MDKLNIIRRYCVLLRHRYGEQDYKFKRVFDGLRDVLYRLTELNVDYDDINYYLEPMYRCYKYGFYGQDGPDRSNEEKSRD